MCVKRGFAINFLQGVQSSSLPRSRDLPRESHSLMSARKQAEGAELDAVVLQSLELFNISQLERRVTSVICSCAVEDQPCGAQPQRTQLLLSLT